MRNKPKPKPKQSSDGSDELLYYGYHTCHALFKHRSKDIIRAYCTPERLQEMGPVLKWCAAHKKAYHVVEKAELEKITASVHHEGFALLAKRRSILTQKELLSQLGVQRSPLVLLDRVQDPHNLGSMMRMMAHFGWKYMVSNQRDALRLSSSAARISEGGSELVTPCFYQDETSFLRELKGLSYLLLGTSAHSKKSLYKSVLPYPALAVVFGNESTGISKSLSAKLDGVVAIPSSGHVQSLNVAMASALVIGECVRQHGLVK